MAACESFSCAEAVSVAKGKDAESYVLRAKWVPHESLKHCLNDIKRKYDVEISDIDSFTVFSTPKQRP